MNPFIEILKMLESSVLNQDEALLQRSLKASLENKIPDVQIRSALLDGLNQVRKGLLSNRVSLPELLLSLDVVASGLDKLKDNAPEWQDQKPVVLVIGVVEGDPHDLGKNIIALIYKSYGYQVWDLGAQVSKEMFINAVREKKADVLALSAMMSTTMTSMPEIIKAVKTISPDTLVMVGGAPLDEPLALAYGADGYAPSAVTVLETTEKLLEKSRGARP